MASNKTAVNRCLFEALTSPETRPGQNSAGLAFAQNTAILKLMESDSNTIGQMSLTDYSKDGVDLTLIRWMLSLTPAERLQFHEERINEIIKIRALNARNRIIRHTEGSL